jgi:F420-0:gamma-glutamyl ligase
MIVKAVKTRKIKADSGTLEQLLDESLHELGESSVVAITSKVASICEGRIVPKDQANLDELIKRESSFYSNELSAYGQRFTITDNTLIAKSGIDKNDKLGYYILWPVNPQKTANNVRFYLTQRFSLKNVGVVITDSLSTPMRYGVTGITLAHSGFKALNSYRHSQANVSGGLAAAAVVVMGEGTEHTPIAIVSDIPFVQFQPHDPSSKDLEEMRLSIKDDFFSMFLSTVDWRKGGHGIQK